MNNINIFEDRRRGDAGSDGANGSGVADIRKSIIDNPTYKSMVNNKLNRTGVTTWDRATEALETDRYGNPAWKSNLDVTNECLHSNDFTNAAWLDVNNRWSIITSSATDPTGGSNATEINLDVTTTKDEDPKRTIQQDITGLDPDFYYTVSFDFKVLSGTVTDLQLSLSTLSTAPYYTFNADLTSSFQRVSVSFMASSSSVSMSIHPVGTSGSRVVLYEVMYEKGSIAHDPINTTTIPVTVAGTGKAERSNSNGYLIEGAKQNLIQNSEDLKEFNWSLSSGSISKNNNVFGEQDRNVQVNFDTTSPLVLTSSGSYVQGTTYTLSVYGHVTAGDVSVFASIGNGDLVQVDSFPTDKYGRRNVDCVAGPGGGASLTLTPSTASAKILLSSFQSETNGLSSYIRNGDALNSRGADNVTVSYDDLIPRPSGVWSFYFNHSGIVNTSDKKYVFTNGLSGTSEFSCYFENNDLNIKNGSVIKTITDGLDSENIAATFDGLNVNLYKNGLLDNSSTYITPSSVISSNLYVGADSSQLNAINASMNYLYFNDKLLTDNEILTISGSSI